MNERANEMLNLGGGYAFHERSGEGFEALVWAMAQRQQLIDLLREMFEIANDCGGDPSAAFMPEFAARAKNLGVKL